MLSIHTSVAPTQQMAKCHSVGRTTVDLLMQHANKRLLWHTKSTFYGVSCLNHRLEWPPPLLIKNIVVIYYAFHSNGYYYCYQYRSLCFCGRRNLYSHAYIFSCNGTRLSNEKFQQWRYEERTFDSNVV